MFGSSPIGPMNFVASTTRSRRSAIALPTICSDSPAEYTSAVSMKLMPASKRAMDHAHAVVVVGVAPRAEHHRAEAVLADVDTAAAEHSRLHGRAYDDPPEREPDRGSATDRWAPMTVDELLDQQAIRDVLIRYTRGIDRMDPDLVRSCYHPDAHDDHGAFRGGTEGFVAWFQEALSFFERTMHFVGNQLVEVDGDVASGRVVLRRVPPPGRDRVRRTGLRSGHRPALLRPARAPRRRVAHRRPGLRMDWSRTDEVTAEWEFGPAVVRGRRGHDDPVFAR